MEKNWGDTPSATLKPLFFHKMLMQLPVKDDVVPNVILLINIFNFIKHGE